MVTQATKPEFGDYQCKHPSNICTTHRLQATPIIYETPLDLFKVCPDQSTALLFPGQGCEADGDAGHETRVRGLPVQRRAPSLETPLQEASRGKAINGSDVG